MASIDGILGNVVHLCACMPAALWRASWQGGLTIALVWTITRCWPRLHPLTRVWLWRLAYLKLLLTFCCVGLVTLRILPSPSASAAAPRTPAASHSPSPSPRPAAVSPAATVPAPPDKFVGSSSVDLRRFRRADVLMPALGLLWLLGVLWGVDGVLRTWHKTRALLAATQPVADTAALRMLEELSQHVGLLWPPELRMGEVAGPLLLDGYHPIIIIPSAMVHADDCGALRLMLAHELAHARQSDLRWGWLAMLTQVLFFFHPLAAPGVREWLLAQEMACDRLAITAVDTDEPTYGHVLVQAAAHAAKCPPLPQPLVMCVSESFQMINRRLAALAAWTRMTRGRRVAHLAVLGAMVLLCFPWRLAAQARPATEHVAEVRIMQSRVDAATQQRIRAILTARLQGIGASAVSSQAEGADRIRLTWWKGENEISDATLAKLCSAGRLEFRLLPKELHATVDDTGATLITGSAGKTLTEAAVLGQSELVMDGSALAPTSKATFDRAGRPAVSFSCNSLAAQQRFAAYTAGHIRWNLCIFLNSHLISAPFIQGRIDGEGIITGSKTMEEAQALAAILNSGELPAPVTLVSSR